MELVAQGDSIYDIIDPADHLTVRQQLALPSALCRAVFFQLLDVSDLPHLIARVPVIPSAWNVSHFEDLRSKDFPSVSSNSYF